MKIYVTGPVGGGKALQLYKENKAFFAGHFAPFFLKQIEALEQESRQMPEETCIRNLGKACMFLCDGNDDPEIMLANSTDCIYICTITDGGLFGALWDGCEKLNCGCEVFLEDIPVRQEVVEIAELLNENPYEMDSFGRLLLFSAGKEDFICIGKTTDRRERVVVHEGNRRFLTPPARQKKDILDRQNHTKKTNA